MNIKKIEIVDLCPQAPCLLNDYFVQAQIVAGKENWRDVLRWSLEMRRQACTHCRPIIEEERPTAKA